MTRAQLIEEIESYGSHESICDYVNDSSNEELEFFLWRLQNKWTWFDGDDRFINTKSLKVLGRDELLIKYEVAKTKLQPQLF